MEIVVLIETLEDGTFLAKTGDPLNLSAVGTTADDAIRQVGLQVNSLAAQGRQVATVTIANGKAVMPPPPMFPADDLYKTDWAYCELQEAIAENSRQEEAANP